MIVTIKTAPLREALAAVSRVIQKSPVQIMESVLISCVDQDIKVSGTSAHADLVIDLGEHNKADFRFAVDVAKLRMFVDRATAETIKFTLPEDTNGGEATINGGNTRGKLKLLSAKDFPKFNEPTGDMMFEAEFNLAEAMNQVRWAVGIGIHLKPVLNGISFIANADGLKLMGAAPIGACTLTIAEPELELKAAGYITVPLVTSNIISQVFKTGASIQAYRGRAVVEAAGFRMGIPLIESGVKYPMNLPPVAGKEVSMQAGLLLDAMRATAAMVDTGKTPIIHIKQGAGHLIQLNGAGTHGEIENEFEAIEGEDSGLSCHLNSTQVVAGLAAVPGDATIRIVVPQGAGSEHKPHKIVAGHWEAFIMPVKV